METIRTTTETITAFQTVRRTMWFRCILLTATIMSPWVQTMDSDPERGTVENPSPINTPDGVDFPFQFFCFTITNISTTVKPQ